MAKAPEDTFCGKPYKGGKCILTIEHWHDGVTNEVVTDHSCGEAGSYCDDEIHAKLAEATLSDHALQSFRSFGRKLGDDYVSVDDVRLCGDDFKIAVAEIEQLRAVVDGVKRRFPHEFDENELALADLEYSNDD